MVQRLVGTKHAPTPPLHPHPLSGSDKEINRDNRQRYQPHIHIGGKHQHQRHHGTGEQGQDVDKEVLHRITQAHHAAVDTCLQLARLVALIAEKRHAKLQYTVHHPQR